MTHLTIYVMLSGKRFVILVVFFVERLRDFWVERLCDFSCGEIALFSHSLTRVPDFFCRGPIIFLWRGCVIFCRLHDLLCG